MSYKPLNLTALMEASEKWVPLPLATAAAIAKGAAADYVEAVKIRRLARIEYLGMLPPMPPAVAQAPKDEKPEEAETALAERERLWVETLSPAEREDRENKYREAIYKAIARASLEPVMNVEQAKRLGDDAYVVFAAIREFWKTETVAQTNGAQQEVPAGV